jgi:glycine/D-amino acid oxidase-like deaminating enzyme
MTYAYARVQEKHMHHIDALIIGGGIAGTATAAYLAHNEQRVTLLDGPAARGIEEGLDSGVLGCLYYPHGGHANPLCPQMRRL